MLPSLLVLETMPELQRMQFDFVLQFDHLLGWLKTAWEPLSESVLATWEPERGQTERNRGMQRINPHHGHQHAPGALSQPSACHRGGQRQGRRGEQR